MPNVEVRVPKNAKSDVTLPIKKRSYGPNSVITLTMDEFLDPSTQDAIRGKYLIAPEGLDTKAKGKDFRFLYRNPTNIPVAGRVVNPNEVFFVPEEKLTDPGLVSLLSMKWAVDDVDYQKSKAIKPMTATPVTKATKEGIAKTTKPVKSVKIVKEPENTDAQVKGIENVPKNMHVHVPNAVKSETVIKKIPKSDSIVVDFDAEDKEAGELSFVDAEQSKKKAAEMKAKNNTEVE